MDLSDDDKIALGDFCERLLREDAFAVMTNLYETATVQQLLSTKPQDRGKRDELFFSIRGVKDLLALMGHMVSEKNRLITDTPKPSDDDDAHFDIYDEPETDLSEDV